MWIVLDVIVVGCDMLMKKLGENKKGNKCLCFVIDVVFLVREFFEGIVED